MASQTVKFEYDPARNILFTEDDYLISIEQDVDEFLSRYQEKLEEIGRRVYFISHIDGLEVKASLYDYYGKKIKALSEKWCLGLARWGTNPVSRMTVRAASIRAKYDINIHNTKESAVAAIETMIDHLKKGSA